MLAITPYRTFAGRRALLVACKGHPLKTVLLGLEMELGIRLKPWILAISIINCLVNKCHDSRYPVWHVTTPSIFNSLLPRTPTAARMKLPSGYFQNTTTNNVDNAIDLSRKYGDCLYTIWYSKVETMYTCMLFLETFSVDALYIFKCLTERVYFAFGFLQPFVVWAGEFLSPSARGDPFHWAGNSDLCCSRLVLPWGPYAHFSLLRGYISAYVQGTL